MQSFKSFNITEKLRPMGNPEWEKPNSGTGEARTDILKRLIQDKKPIELAKGGSFKVSDIDNALQTIDAYVKADYQGGFTLNGDDGKVYKNTQIGKAKVFGGATGGAGSGTKDTKRNECHNAAMMQAFIDHGMQSIEHFNDELLEASYKKVKGDAKWSELADIPEDWMKSSYYITQELLKGGYINKNHVFHRGSKEMIKLYALKDIAYKNNGFKPLKDDKWNPGDVWAIAKDFNFNELDTSSVGAFNKDMLEHFNTKRLVGLSLKGPMTKPNPPVDEYNNEYPPDTDNYKIVKLKLESDRGNFWSSKATTIVYDDGELMFKDNSPGDNVKAEIKGKKARGGGLSWGVMQEFIRRELRKKLPDHAKGIKAIAKKISKELEGDPKKHRFTKRIFFKMYNNFYKNESYDDFVENMKQQDWTWISAKLGSLYVHYYLDTNAGQKANNVITHFVNYAGSKSLDSSVYVKAGK